MCVCSLLEEILLYIHTVARCVEENADKPTAKFWRALLNKAYDVLDKVSFYHCTDGSSAGLAGFVPPITSTFLDLYFDGCLCQPIGECPAADGYFYHCDAWADG